MTLTELKELIKQERIKAIKAEMIRWYKERIHEFQEMERYLD